MLLFPSYTAANRRRWAAVAVLLAGMSVPAIAAATPADAVALAEAAQDESLVLEVFINGTPTDKVGEFTRRNGRLYAKADELRQLGLAVGGAADLDVALTDIAGVTVRFDEAALKLFINASTEKLASHDLSARQDLHYSPADRGGTGMLVNYDAVAVAGRGGISATAALEARAFSNGLSVDSRFLASEQGLVRLESVLSYADPEHLRRYLVGDIVTGGLAWTRPVRMGGVQVSRAFDMRPDLITFPLPTVRGAIALPSSIDVLVNGLSQMRSDVAPGPFSISRLSLPAGAATIAVQSRDALGRVTETDVHTYAAPGLLAPGLSSFSLEAGAIRSSFGFASNGYHALGVSGTYRRGFSGFTLEGHAEGRSGLLEAGLGSAFLLGDFASASVAVAASQHEGRTGFLLHTSLERQTPAYHVSLTAQATSRDYNDLASVGGDSMPRLQLQASAGASLGSWGGFDLSYVCLRADGAPGGLLSLYDTPTPGPARSFRLSALTASYSRSIGPRAQISATGFRDFGSRAAALSINLSFALGGRRQASAATSITNGRVAAGFDLRQNASRVSELGWRAQGTVGPNPHGFAEAQYRSPYGTFGGGIDASKAGVIGELRASGSVSFMDGTFFAANPIRDSFAIVDADGQRGLLVKEDNQDVGRTNRGGKLILTDLRGFDSNRIGFSAKDLPLDASFSTDEIIVRPHAHTGIVAHLGIKRGTAVLVYLVDNEGRPIAVGSQAYLNGAAEPNPIGYDGQLFLASVPEHNHVLVDVANGGRCEAQFNRASASAGIVELEQVTCRNRENVASS